MTLETPHKFDVFTFGNALVDYIYENVEERFLSSQALKRGDMHLVNADKAALFDALLRDSDKMCMAGGSATNVACGVANLGGKAAFVGCLGYDDDGQFFLENLIKQGVTPMLEFKRDKESGVARTFITRDSENNIERTFATNLGAAPYYKADSFPLDELDKAGVFHTTGYSYQAMKGVFIKALDHCREKSIPVSLDLSSPSVILEFKVDLKRIVSDHAHFLFMNEQESCAFTGSSDPLAALDVFTPICEVVIVKLGAEGAVIGKGEERIKIDAFKAEKVVDVNGAGDGFTAGFLYAWSRNCPLDKCGVSGAYYGARIVENLGARLQYSPKKEIDALLGL